eukprot:2458758-Amphidinium_carterae.1
MRLSGLCHEDLRMSRGFSHQSLSRAGHAKVSSYFRKEKTLESRNPAMKISAQLGDRKHGCSLGGPTSFHMLTQQSVV